MSFLPDSQAPRFGLMMVFSIVLHLLLIVGSATWKITPSYRLTFGPVYEVKLVDRVPATGLDYGIGTDVPSRASASAALQVRKEQAAIPVRRIEREKGLAPEVKKSLDEIRKRAAQEPLGVASQPDSGGEGVTNDYLRVMWERIRGEWVLPPGIVTSDRWEAVVYLKVLKSGKLVDVKLEKSSGNAYFDRSVLRAIQKADPLPPFPPDLREGSIEVGIRFRSQEAWR